MKRIFIIIQLSFIILFYQLINMPTINEARPGLRIMKIKGPTFAEVNETIVFTITSEGSPVEGALVSFAGHYNRTNANGIVTFKIDFVGPFKAIARKKGFKTCSTIVWIFPRGNEKFQIRSTKSVSDPEQCRDTICAFKLAGFNFARIKAYYTYDELGNVYPIIITLGEAEKLSDEARNIIKEMYRGDVPYYDLWIRVPNDVHLKNLEWMISRVRDWGFKVFLLAEILPPAVTTGRFERVAPIALNREAFKRFLEQRKREALILTEFAEKQKIEILDPIGPAWFPEEPKEAALEQLLLYKELLPKIRSMFKGKLAVWMIGRISDCVNGMRLKEYNYSGFDYLTLWFGCGGAYLNTNSPIKWKDAVHKYFDFAEYLANKYKLKIFPCYIAGFQYLEEYDEFFNEFMSNFSSLEDAKIWFMNIVFDEILSRGITSIDIHPLWFVESCSFGGPHSWWESKRPLKIVTDLLCLPWNIEGKRALKALQYATLMVNLITTKSSNSGLIHWMLNKKERAYKAFREGNYTLTNIISQKILGYFLHMKNPLNIIIDGNGDEWQDLDPAYFNPSQTFPWFNLIFCYGKDKVKDFGNLKCLYAVNDPDNLYLMLEFYNSTPNILPYINIDVSGEWSHQRGKEFHLILHHDCATLWTWEYKGLERPDPEHPFHKLADLEIACGDVVELKIPLKFIGNPEKINLIVWYPWMAPWGDIEIDIVDWKAFSFNSSILLSAIPRKVFREEPIIISGFIYPAHAGVTVALTYKMPNGTKLIKNVTSTILGEFEDMFIPNTVGNWTVKASWSGDFDHKGVESLEITFLVMPKPAKFKVTNLIINPSEVEVGQLVTISVKVENIGDVNGSYTIYLKVNDTIINKRTVILAGGEFTIVEFKITIHEVGTFLVDVAGLKGFLIVRKSIFWKKYLIIITIMVLIIIMLLIMYIRRRGFIKQRS